MSTHIALSFFWTDYVVVRGYSWALCSEITPGKTQQTLCSAGNQTLVSLVQASTLPLVLSLLSSTAPFLSMFWSVAPETISDFIRPAACDNLHTIDQGRYIFHFLTRGG